MTEGPCPLNSMHCPRWGVLMIMSIEHHTRERKEALALLAQSAQKIARTERDKTFALVPPSDPRAFANANAAALQTEEWE
jgi:hypothetical protein